ncbi:MAG: glycosyltransferase [Parachlamydiaceae bacterium]
MSFFFFLHLIIPWQVDALTVNVFTWRNGEGLEADQKIISRVLEEQGHLVYCKDLYSVPENPEKVDLNIFFQVIDNNWLPYAKANYFVPNPEWYYQEISLLKEVDLILCRTKEVERIFKDLNLPTYYLGFTSRDCYLPEVQKDFSVFFHLGGSQGYKGTAPLVSLWLHQPTFPSLVLIKQNWVLKEPCPNNLHWVPERLDEPTLRFFQNVCGVHLCLSETEGFGHYLMEAMSAGSVVITTNGPPMNEFITDERCLVPYEKTGSKYLGINYYINASLLEITLRSFFNLSIDERKEIGRVNRENYLQRTREFKSNLARLMQALTTKLTGKE